MDETPCDTADPVTGTTVALPSPQVATALHQYKASLRRYSPVQEGPSGLPWPGQPFGPLGLTAADQRRGRGQAHCFQESSSRPI